MLSKNTVKFIKSLQQKKFRQLENSFFVEGTKNVTELMQSDFKVTHLLYTEKFASSHQSMIRSFPGQKYEVLPGLLASTGSFSSNDSALAVAHKKENRPFLVDHGELALALEDIRDPGNLGTVIRIADWYGVKKIVLSEQSADFYNPKVLHASMGSFTRVAFFYTALDRYLSEADVPVYGAFLDGDNIHRLNLEARGIVLLGNESKGISEGLEQLVTRKLSIPSFGGAESLNVAIAAAVICDNLRRSQPYQ